MIKKIYLAALILAVTAALAAAQGIIVPDSRPHPTHVISVKSQSVNVRIETNAAITTVNQVFFNNAPRAMEGTYIFPVPKGATVSDFYLWIDGKKVKGELLDSRQAANIYRDIVRRMKDPALLELTKFNLFKASIFPIPPRGERQIELKYTESLVTTDGMVRYNYPLKARSTVYRQPIGLFSLVMDISSAIPMTNIYSPTHKVDISRKNDTSATIGIEQKGFLPDNDFQLYFSLSKKDFGLSFAGHKEAGENEGYCMMLLAPRSGLEQNQISSKDVVFVLDTSGSMQDDDKIGQALRALVFGIKSLRSSDRFGLITFATEVRSFRESMIPASKENVEAAVKHLENTSATGATNIYEALQKALSMMRDRTGPRYVVFLTDGLPTHVERDPNVIIRKAGEWAPKGVRIFSWGVGFDVDTRLLDTISNDHGGVSEYVRPKEEMELKLGQFFEKISHPVLTDLELMFEGITVKDMYPRRLPDMFKGSQIVVFGRFSGSKAAKATLSGVVDDQKKSFAFDLNPKVAEDGDFIAQLWATRKVGHLLEEIRLHGENAELKTEVISLAKKFGLVTPYTSYLVTEPIVDRVRQPVRPGTPPVPYEPRVSPETGEIEKVEMRTTGDAAVRYSKKVRKLKEEEKAGAGASTSVKRVGGKTFTFTDGIWTDNEYKEGMKLLMIEFDSTAYYNLLNKHVEMVDWLSIGENIIVVWKNVAYHIVSAP